MRIAEGHTFDVYRAQMGSKTCVVKLYKQINDASCEKLWDAFRTETEIHHLCHHPNILDLLCCFSEAGRHCLVYPYLPNGSLFHRLHHQEEERPLSWQERLAIIKGIAKALHHLYAAQPSPVICGNISSANILLDDGLQPKLSNFGLARLRPHSANRYCTTTVDTSSHSNPGYLPADFFRDGKLSFSVDVYSFGMIIMETVTGRKVGAKEDGAERTPLRELLVTEVEDGGGVDSCLRFLDVAAGQWPDAVALGLLDLALDCTASHRSSRPSMETVILALSKLLPSPSRPSADEPRSLVDGSPVLQSPPSSIPVEHDEQLSLHSSQAQAGPCECSQSEVTYLSDNVDALAEDLYSSWPVQCSCPAETSGVACEDCRANGFTANHTGSPQNFIGVEENPAKQRLRNKLDLYNGGLIGTEELFSETGLQ
ncbi:interleukin-1 receptor-associated kinase 3 isoform X1 [Pempheris klunzingeri]|uniref:interleukin-1 receptor-associated kinase 3 isoform X1 n=1 Tax=Pempheris klunzingeri TaxID=3127111 RepID=UPI0039812C51